MISSIRSSTNELCRPRINGPVPHKPISPNFFQVFPIVIAVHIFHDVVFIQICQCCALRWAKVAFSVCQKCSVAQKYVKMRFRPRLRPGPRWDSWRQSPWTHAVNAQRCLQQNVISDMTQWISESVSRL